MFPESRMREIRPSGLTRCEECGGELTTSVDSITSSALSAYSTPSGFLTPRGRTDMRERSLREQRGLCKTPATFSLIRTSSVDFFRLI